MFASNFFVVVFLIFVQSNQALPTTSEFAAKSSEPLVSVANKVETLNGSGIVAESTSSREPIETFITETVPSKESTKATNEDSTLTGKVGTLNGSGIVSESTSSREPIETMSKETASSKESTQDPSEDPILTGKVETWNGSGIDAESTYSREPIETISTVTVSGVKSTQTASQGPTITVTKTSKSETVNGSGIVIKTAGSILPEERIVGETVSSLESTRAASEHPTMTSESIKLASEPKSVVNNQFSKVTTKEQSIEATTDEPSAATTIEFAEQVFNEESSEEATIESELSSTEGLHQLTNLSTAVKTMSEEAKSVFTESTSEDAEDSGNEKGDDSKFDEDNQKYKSTTEVRDMKTHQTNSVVARVAATALLNITSNVTSRMKVTDGPVSPMKKEISTTGVTEVAEGQKSSTSEADVITEPTEGSFTFILPDFHAHESSNSSTGQQNFNDTEWAAMGAAASAEDADEMFDDPCAYLSHRVEHLVGLNISKQAVQQFITELNLDKFEESKLPTLKKSLQVCVELHEKADGEEEAEAEFPPACKNLHKMVDNVCKVTQGCDLEEIMGAIMTHIKHLITTDSLHDALVMMRACSDQTYHEHVEKLE